MQAIRGLAADRDALLRAIALLVWVAACGLITVTLVLWALRGPPPQATGFVQGPLGVSAVAATGLLYASVGAFLLRRRPRDAIGWALLGIGVGMAIVLPLDQFVEASVHAFRPVPLGTLLVVWTITSVHLPASGAAVVFVLLLFPTGRMEWRWARLTLGLATGGAALLALSSALRPEGLLWYPTLPNPVPIPSGAAPFVTLVSLAGVAAFVASLVLAAWCLVWRYRYGSTRERRQLAWVAIGAASLACSVALLFVGRYTETVGGSEGERLSFLAAVGAAFLPLALFRFATVTASLGQESRDLTFLFTDLQDSTAMYERIGDMFAFDLVRLHFDTLTAVTRHHHGAIVKTIGDALMARFLDPVDAVRAALEMFERLARFNRSNATQLILKVGLHRGDAIVVSSRGRTDYFGQTVNIASRVGAVAGAGEIVLSDAVYQAEQVPRLLAGYPIRRERATLKGVAGEVTIHRVTPELLASD